MVKSLQSSTLLWDWCKTYEMLLWCTLYQSITWIYTYHITLIFWLKSFQIFYFALRMAQNLWGVALLYQSIKCTHICIHMWIILQHLICYQSRRKIIGPDDLHPSPNTSIHIYVYTDIRNIWTAKIHIKLQKLGTYRGYVLKIRVSYQILNNIT